MASNPASVTKFRALRALDSFLGARDPVVRSRNLEAARTRLEDRDFDLLGATVANVEEIARDGAPAPLEHLREHWLSGRYFPGLTGADIPATIREAFLAAILDAQPKNLPVQAVWVCATEDSNADVFRVDHVVGSVCVTVVIVTPRPDAAATGR